MSLRRIIELGDDWQERTTYGNKTKRQVKDSDDGEDEYKVIELSGLCCLADGSGCKELSRRMVSVSKCLSEAAD